MPPPGTTPNAGHDARWRAGLTLAERLSVLHDAGAGNQIRPRAGGAEPPRWRIERRADIGKTRNLAAIDAHPPRWLREFRAAYAATNRRQQRGRDFLAAVEPLVLGARKRVAAALKASAPQLCSQSGDKRAALLATFESGLRDRLYAALTKTLVLELGVAAERKVLGGENAEARFAFFCDCLANSQFAAALLEQYPVLVRRLVAIVGNWETATLALLSRLGASRPILVQTVFTGDDPGALLSVQSTGNSHRAGQAVHILQFESGRKLVYKPRSVGLELCFNIVVGWLNRNGAEPDLMEVCALDEGDFGWMAFVDAKPCQSPAEIERYFVRLGAQLALGYVLGGTDLHFENVIAHGEYPVLVDLETLFQTPLPSKRLTGASAAGWQALQMSVISTLLLPLPMDMAGDDRWTDVSALGHREGELTPFRIPIWSDDGSDAMRLVHRRLPMAGGEALPQLDGARVTASAYTELVVRGLAATYRFLQQHTKALLADDGPLAAAAGKPARHVFRATAWYARLLDASYHPRFLEDAVAAESFLRDQLRATQKESSQLAGIQDAEVADLMAGDIPYFSSRVGHRGPVTGGVATDFVLPGDGWSECHARLRALNGADLECQTWLTRVAMADLETPVEARSGISPAPSRDPAPGELVAVAARIGDRLREVAIVPGNHATWLVPLVVSKKQLATDIAQLDLYNGLPGIALFLGHLGRATGDDRYDHLAASAIDEALALYNDADDKSMAAGGHGGLGGLAWSLMELALPLDRPDWSNRATTMLRNAAAGALRSSSIDVISGQSGFLLAGLALYRRTSDTVLLRRLGRVAAKLRRLATASTAGKTKLPSLGEAGVAHGRAGIGFALLRWADATSDESYRDAAIRLIRDDVEAIDTNASTSAMSMNRHLHSDARLGWCRGALGIARMALLTNVADGGVDADWLNGIADEIIAQGTDGPLCLCHGALGQLDYLMALSERGLLRDRTGAASWRQKLLTRIVDGDWVADQCHRLESPGLMLELAGTGYALLQAAQPEALPSILTLS